MMLTPKPPGIGFPHDAHGKIVADIVKRSTGLTVGRDGMLYREGSEPVWRDDLFVNDNVRLPRKVGSTETT